MEGQHGVRGCMSEGGRGGKGELVRAMEGQHGVRGCRLEGGRSSNGELVEGREGQHAWKERIVAGQGE